MSTNENWKSGRVGSSECELDSAEPPFMGLILLLSAFLSSLDTNKQTSQLNGAIFFHKRVAIFICSIWGQLAQDGEYQTTVK